MNEKEIRAALEQIEPADGAQERMYQNILKKAAAPKKTEKPVWQRYAALVACLVLVCTAGFFALRGEKSAPVQSDPADVEFSQLPVMVGSPFEDVQSAANFEKLGFTIDAPEDAENVQYSIIDGEIARVRFSVRNHKYTYEAAKLDGNFSCADGDAVGSVALNAKYDAVLDRLSQDKWRAHWSDGEVSYFLSNFDGAGEEDITDLLQTLIAASCG